MHLFPGSGVTVFTVWRTPLDWWLVLVQQAEAWVRAQEKEVSRGH